MHETKVLEIKDALSKNMIELRKQQKMSQAKLAEAIGKSVQTINTIESGKTWPDHATIQAIAKALGAEETDLFNDPSMVSTLNYLRNNK
jgi:transcriptional regulator with XRE-family HTH domain